MKPRHVTRVLSLLTGLGSVSLLACTFAPPADDDRFARGALVALRDGATRIPGPPSDEFPENLGTTIDTLRAYGFSDTASVIEFAAVGSGRGHAAGLTYQLGKPGHWAVAVVEVRAEPQRIILIAVKPMSVSYAERNRFTLTLPPLRGGLFVIAGFALIWLTAAWLVLRTPMPMPMRVLWYIIAFAGVGIYSVNWTTGDSYAKLVASHFFGIIVIRRGTAGPWMINAVLPIGALVALFAIRRARAGSSERDMAPPRT